MRYHEWIKESLHLERVEDEKKRYNELLNTLVFHKGDYASHPSTGIVYDIRIINKNISILDIQIDEIKERLNA